MRENNSCEYYKNGEWQVAVREPTSLNNSVS